MRATVLGCGEAFDERLPNTSLLLAGEAGTFLFDCGYSVPPEVWRTVEDPGTIDLIYISHPHADHYFGLPALLGRMWEDGRTRPLTILTQPVVIEQIREILETGYRGLAARFQYEIQYLAATAGAEIEAHGATFRFAATTHPAPNLAVRAEWGGKAFCYSGDGMFTGQSRKLFAGADLLVHEAFAFETRPGHADIEGVIGMAGEEGVRRTALAHVSRRVRRAEWGRIERAVAQARGTQASAPEPGAVYEVGA